MGLAGGIVRRVLSKSPRGSSSSTGRGGGGVHTERSSGDHRRRSWSSLRMYLCGDETSAAAADGDEDDDQDQDGTTVSARSFETPCAMTMMTRDQAQAPVADQHGHVNGDGSPGQLRGQGAMVLPTEPAGEEEAAATLIQSAFRGLMARRRQLLPELEGSLSGQDGCCAEEPCKSPASPSTMAASVEVQVGESLSNLRLSDADDGGASVSAQHRGGASQTKSSRPQVFRAKEEWDDSTLSSNMLRMRIQSKMEATTRRERALAYAFSQQLRSCGGSGVGGTKKRSSRSEQGEFNVGWSWLERWMATRQAEPCPSDDGASRNAADAGSVAGRRVVVVRRRPQGDVAVEEKESCGSNDVSAVSFDGSSAGGRSGLSCYRPGKNRIRGARNLPRRKVAAAAAAEHRLKERSHKMSKKARQREDRQAEVEEADDPRQPPTDY